MSVENDADFEVLVLAPAEQDAEIAARVLTDGGFPATAFSSLADLCDRLRRPAGALLMAEEALSLENVSTLKDVLSSQETWSNLPFVLMTSRTERLLTVTSILDLFGHSCLVSLVERPFRVVTLLSLVRVALQARERQYQVRDLLREQSIAIEQQSQALRQRDEFLSIASHELKTPITSIKLQVQMRQRLLKRGDQSIFSPERVTSLVNLTETQINRLSRLVDDMLDITRIENGKLSLNRERTELGHLVNEVLNGFRAQFQAAQCPLEIEFEDEVYGDWDPYRIEQVVANLFSNAIKYGAGKPVSVRIRTHEGRVQLVVQDHGMGIAPAHQQRIFDRFERAVDGSGISGLGLGLYITRQILDLHGGTIRVESEGSQGSAFIVELPASPSDAHPNN